MGQCVSYVPQGEAPLCKVCGNRASASWAQLGMDERAKWVWAGQEATHRRCLVVHKMDKIQFEKERQRYAQAKEELYPKPTEGLKPLKKVKSGERWDSTRSFTSSWRPSSSLQRLLSAIRSAQEENPGQHVGLQRKATGFVPASTMPALPGGFQQPPPLLPREAEAARCAHSMSAEAQQEERQQGQHGQAQKGWRQQQLSEEDEVYAARQAQLLTELEEEHEVELVEEESLGASLGHSASWACSTRSAPTQDECSGEAPPTPDQPCLGAQVPPPPPQQQQPTAQQSTRQDGDWQGLPQQQCVGVSDAQLKGAGFHGDSASSFQGDLEPEPAACQLVSSRA